MWLSSGKKTVSKLKWYLSENLIFQNLSKNRKVIEKFWNILTFDKESKRKLLTLIPAESFIKNNLYNFRAEIFIMFKWEIFLFQILASKTHSDIMEFQLQ